MKITSAEFIKSAGTFAQYAPDILPEVAFVGRSNSGKSTLINMLTGHRHLAKASTSPGRTQLIQFFIINKTISFADLPGYGYAKVPAAVKASWRPMIENYLRERANLKLVVLVADIRRNITDEERLLIDWLTLYNRPVVLVLSKSDKVSRSQKFLRLNHIRESLNSLPSESILPYSAQSGEGREKIWFYIEKILG